MLHSIKLAENQSRESNPERCSPSFSQSDLSYLTFCTGILEDPVWTIFTILFHLYQPATLSLWLVGFHHWDSRPHSGSWHCLTGHANICKHRLQFLKDENFTPRDKNMFGEITNVSFTFWQCCVLKIRPRLMKLMQNRKNMFYHHCFYSVQANVNAEVCVTVGSCLKYSLK